MELSPELYVTLKVGPDQAFEAPVLEVNWGEALASFPADAAPVLSIGQAVELDFRGPRIPGAAHVRGFVILRAEEERVRLYRFQLEFRRTGVLPERLFNFLGMWLQAHLGGVDREYARHCRAA